MNNLLLFNMGNPSWALAKTSCDELWLHLHISIFWISHQTIPPFFVNTTIPTLGTSSSWKTHYKIWSLKLWKEDYVEACPCMWNGFRILGVKVNLSFKFHSCMHGIVHRNWRGGWWNLGITFGMVLNAIEKLISLFWKQGGDHHHL